MASLAAFSQFSIAFMVRHHCIGRRAFALSSNSSLLIWSSSTKH